jgi:hypothetical protein
MTLKEFVDYVKVCGNLRIFSLLRHEAEDVVREIERLQKPKKYFKINYILSDTCGNVWKDETRETEYFCANNIKELWNKLDNPTVSGFHINGKWVYRSQTPKGKGYGIWESNPEFNFDRDALAVNCLICDRMEVNEIVIQTV